jgi:glycosyltransferase involved in cell wall biosynthesis
MKILFDLRRVGLGNNGGSSTLVKSGNTLVEMGHEVTFIDTMRNYHKWTKLKATHLIIKDDNKIPDADAIIATGYKSVATTVKAPKRCGLKMHWIRAWEHWQMGENEIVQKVLKQPTIKVVNSICLRDKLSSYGFSSYIIRPGYDFEELFPLNIRNNKKYFVIGGLYREGIHGQRKRTDWIFEVIRYMKTNYRDVKLWMFGSEKKPEHHIIDNYTQSPTPSQKNEIYNNIDIWLAPTMSEGLHLPPAEAMLTECSVIATKAELSGVQDYIIPGETGLLSKNDLRSFISDTDHLYNHPSCRKRVGTNGRQKILELGDRKQNMQKLIDLIGNLK